MKNKAQSPQNNLEADYGYKIGDHVGVSNKDGYLDGIITGFTTLGAFVMDSKIKKPTANQGEWFSWSAFRFVRL